MKYVGKALERSVHSACTYMVKPGEKTKLARDDEMNEYLLNKNTY